MNFIKHISGPDICRHDKKNVYEISNIKYEDGKPKTILSTWSSLFSLT